MKSGFLDDVFGLALLTALALVVQQRPRPSEVLPEAQPGCGVKDDRCLRARDVHVLRDAAGTAGRPAFRETVGDWVEVGPGGLSLNREVAKVISWFTKTKPGTLPYAFHARGPKAVDGGSARRCFNALTRMVEEADKT